MVDSVFDEVGGFGGGEEEVGGLEGEEGAAWVAAGLFGFVVGDAGEEVGGAEDVVGAFLFEGGDFDDVWESVRGDGQLNNTEQLRWIIKEGMMETYFCLQYRGCQERRPQICRFCRHGL